MKVLLFEALLRRYHQGSFFVWVYIWLAQTVITVRCDHVIEVQKLTLRKATLCWWFQVDLLLVWVTVVYICSQLDLGNTWDDTEEGVQEAGM